MTAAIDLVISILNYPDSEIFQKHWWLFFHIYKVVIKCLPNRSRVRFKLDYTYRAENSSWYIAHHPLMLITIAYFSSKVTLYVTHFRSVFSGFFLHFGKCVYGRRRGDFTLLFSWEISFWVKSNWQNDFGHWILDNYGVHDVSLVTPLNRGLIMSAISSLLGFSILDILHFRLVGYICLRESV